MRGRKPNRFLHRMGFLFSPSLLYARVGAYDNPIAKRNWRKLNERIAKEHENTKEDE